MGASRETPLLHRRTRTRAAVAVALLALATMVAAPAYAASDDDSSGPGKGGNDDRGLVIKTGRCTDGSLWKLKLHHDDGLVEAEFEVDQNRIGRRWRVTM